MPVIETKIWQALKARVQTLPAPVNYPIDWPMEVFDKPQAGGRPSPYIEARHLPNTTVRRFIGSDEPHQRMGILQLTLMWPAALVGSGASQQTPDTVGQLAGLTAAHFPTDLQMPFQDIAVRVEKAPDVAQPFRDDAYWRVPISIRWQSFA